MKIRTIPLAALTAITIAGPASSATILFSDNFLATSNQTPNDQTTNVGRQGGTLATLGYLQDGNVQIGNGTNPAPHGGNDMLIAFGGRAYVNYDFSAQTVPIEITFNGLVNSSDASDFIGFSVGSNSIDWVTGANVSSVLFRANGATELWDRGSSSVGATGSNVGLNVWTDYKIVISDTAGTGGAWGTGGSRIDYYSAGSFVGTFNITQLATGDGYLGLASSGSIAGFDNLTITAIPEPGAALLGGIGLLALLRRRR